MNLNRPMRCLRMPGTILMYSMTKNCHVWEGRRTQDFRCHVMLLTSTSKCIANYLWQLEEMNDTTNKKGLTGREFIFK